MVAIIVAVFFISENNALSQKKKAKAEKVTEAWPKLYYPKIPEVGLNEAKATLESILMKCYTWDKEKIVSSAIKVTVFDDRIELLLHAHTPKPIPDYNRTYYFPDILKHKIVGEIYANPEIIVTLADLRFAWTGEGNLEELADYLYFFQQYLDCMTTQYQYDSLITVFKPVADHYITLKEKPAISEECRKYIVQANMFNEQKQYYKAMGLYNKAVELDQTGYPPAYSNLALLSAQVHRYDRAIYFMKKYLLLEPQASDARSAQDKIYEWEAMMTNQ
jgi:tetratricopeptide (TPR) repeat protein